VLRRGKVFPNKIGDKTRISFEDIVIMDLSLSAICADPDTKSPDRVFCVEMKDENV